MLKLLKDITADRKTLGNNTTAFAFRLLEVSIKNILMEEFGEETSDDIFRKAGHLSGLEFFKKDIETELNFDKFFEIAKNSLEENKVGILKLEHKDLEKLEFILVINENIDCAGILQSDNTQCVYMEGFLEGIFEFYFDKEFKAREMDCICCGSKSCRFIVRNISV